MKQGDTLSSIAAQFHTTVALLRQLNGMSPTASTIYVGQTLQVPR